MARFQRAEPIYRIPEQFRQRCLIEDQSLLWPEAQAWTSGNIETLRAALVDGYIGGADQSFTEKLAQQLATAIDDVHRVAGDINAMYHLYPHDITKATKIRRVEDVLNWRLAPAADSPLWPSLVEAFDIGAGSVGTFYQTKKHAFFVYLLKLAALCRNEPGAAAEDERLIALARRAHDEVPDSIAAHRALLHMQFPDRFERTVSSRQRARIIAAWPEYTDGIEDSDYAFRAIRTGLATSIDAKDVDFYDNDAIYRLWNEVSFNDARLKKIREFVLKTIPDEEQRGVVLETIAEAVERANSANPASWALLSPNTNELRLGVSWTEALVIQKQAFRLIVNAGPLHDAFPDQSLADGSGIEIIKDAYPSTPNLIRVEVPYGQVVEWLPKLAPLIADQVGTAASEVKTRSHFHDRHVKSAVTFLNEELDLELPQPSYSSVPTSASIAGWWIEKTDTRDTPSRKEGDWSVGKTVFYWPEKLAAGHVQAGMRENDVVLHFTDQQAITGISRVVSAWAEQIPPPADSGWDIPAVSVTRLADFRVIDPPLHRDDVFEPFESRLRRVAADGHRNLFYTTKGRIGLGGNGFLSPLPRPLLDILRDAYRTSSGKELVPEGWPMPGSDPEPDDLLNLLVARTHMPAEDLLELRDLIEDKKQLILEGPPGAGKTYLADFLARWVADVPLDEDPDGRVELVQFHQSYGYEDFVQGLRPRTVDGAVVFEVVDGIFLDLCKRAAADPERPHVLIIDEINRGNLSRIFGELLMALEYRDRPIRLPYGKDPLRIPENLYLIGTMNSTDRSLALIDYALRRRFYFHRLLPVENGAAGVYGRWLAANVDGPERDRLHRLFVNLNQELIQRLSPDFQVGHSYFMRGDIHTDAGLRRVWTHAVTPLLREYFHSTRDRAGSLDHFTIERLLGLPGREPARDADAAQSFADTGEPE